MFAALLSLSLLFLHLDSTTVSACLGLRMSFPLSSQSMLKSKRTSRVRETRMEVPMTRLCTPARKSRSMVRAERENQGWR